MYSVRLAQTFAYGKRFPELPIRVTDNGSNLAVTHYVNILPAS